MSHTQVSGEEFIKERSGIGCSVTSLVSASWVPRLGLSLSENGNDDDDDDDGDDEVVLAEVKEVAVAVAVVVTERLRVDMPDRVVDRREMG